MATQPQIRLSKAIVDLTSYNTESGLNFSNFLIPVQYEEQNFNIKIQDILDIISKDFLNLENVDNTTDANKPISLLISIALETKANLEHNHELLQVNGLTEALGDKLNRNESIQISLVENLAQALVQKAATDHTHEISQINFLQNALNGFSTVNHTHYLASLDGYAAFVTSLSDNFDLRPTTDVVQNMINTTITDSLVIQNMITTSISESSVNYLQSEW